MCNGCGSEQESTRVIFYIGNFCCRYKGARETYLWSVFEMEKGKDDFQPTNKRHTKLSAPNGKQGTSLKRYHWKSISKGYVQKILRTQCAVSTLNNGLCHAKSA